jgi:uncharacterized protein (DUF4213/DUF364 family)
MYPDLLFDRGVTVLRGINVHDADGLLPVVSKGGSGYFFCRWAEKVAIIKPQSNQNFNLENGVTHT